MNGWCDIFHSVKRACTLRFRGWRRLRSFTSSFFANRNLTDAIIAGGCQICLVAWPNVSQSNFWFWNTWSLIAFWSGASFRLPDFFQFPCSGCGSAYSHSFLPSPCRQSRDPSGFRWAHCAWYRWMAWFATGFAGASFAPVAFGASVSAMASLAMAGLALPAQMLRWK